MKKLDFMRLTLATVMMAFLAACSSTEVIDPPKQIEKIGETITLNIATPELPKGTRAGTDHKLRYTVICYEGTKFDKNKEHSRQEVIASNATGSATDQVTFTVFPGTYSFIIFGDFIPDANVAAPNQDGHYLDAYYDTTFDDDKVYMISFYNFSKDNDPRTRYCVNNDNYECFAYKITVVKGAAEEKRDITLNRIVSRINVVSTTEATSAIESINGSAFDFLCHYNFSDGGARTHANGKIKTHDLNYDKINNLYTINRPQTSQNEGETLLFYFYTLAPQNGESQETLGNIEFTINFAEGEPRTTKIPEKTIKPNANYIYTVKGAFLSDVVKEGDIILNLSATQEDWKNSVLANP